jgi:hypothetical protein
MRAMLEKRGRYPELIYVFPFRVSIGSCTIARHAVPTRREEDIHAAVIPDRLPMSLKSRVGYWNLWMSTPPGNPPKN